MMITLPTGNCTASQDKRGAVWGGGEGGRFLHELGVRGGPAWPQGGGERFCMSSGCGGACMVAGCGGEVLHGLGVGGRGSELSS